MDRLRGIRRDDRGTAALEFALIAPIFFALMFSFYDIGMLMLRQVLLGQAVDKTMRELRIAPAPMPIDDFVGRICDRAMVLPDCKAKLVVDVQPVGRFAVNLPTDGAPCRDPNIKAVTPMRYEASDKSQILYVRVCASATPLLPGYSIAAHFPTNSAGEVQIVSTTAFMGE